MEVQPARPRSAFSNDLSAARCRVHPDDRNCRIAIVERHVLKIAIVKVLLDEDDLIRTGLIAEYD